MVGIIFCIASTMTVREKPGESSGTDSGEILQRTSLSLAGHPLPPIDSVTRTLAQFVHLRRLDLSNIQDEGGAGLHDVQWLAKAASISRKRSKKDGSTPLAKRLSWLNISGNEALGNDGAMEGLEQLVAINVLNASHCAIRTLPPGISAMRNLKALVLSHNAISALPSVFPHLPELNTLVLSYNNIESLPMTLPTSLPALKKLSVSHNSLKGPLPDFTICVHLREVRLNGNEELGELPKGLGSWGRGLDGSAPGVYLLDVGSCGLDSPESIEPLLHSWNSGRKGLANLSIKGNDVALDPELCRKILAVHPTINLLDNKHVHEQKTDGADQADEPERKRGAEEVETPPENKRTRVETDEKKPRKRSGRGKKSRTGEAEDERRIARAGPPPDESAEDARRLARAGPPPDESAEDSRRLRRAGPPPGESPEDARRLARAGPPPDESPEDARRLARAGPPPVDAPTQTRSKKTRRSKKGAPVELEMGDTETEAPAAHPQPETEQQAPKPRDSPADTSVVRVVDVARKRQTAPPAVLARRENVDLGGW